MKWLACLAFGLIAVPAVCFAQHAGVYVLSDPSSYCRGIMVIHREGDEVLASIKTKCADSRYECNYEGRGTLMEDTANIGTADCKIEALFQEGLVYITPDPKCQVCKGGASIAGRYLPKQKSGGRGR